MRFLVHVDVMLKAGVADPQGQTIERALPALGHAGVDAVRVGKRIELHIEADDEDHARTLVEEMCESLLANPVLETFEIAVLETGAPAEAQS